MKIKNKRKSISIIKFRPFYVARLFTRDLKLKNQKEWQTYWKSGQKPEDIPYNPNKIYKEEFQGFGDWLGTENVANQKKEFRPLPKALKFANSLELNIGLDGENIANLVRSLKIYHHNLIRHMKKNGKKLLCIGVLGLKQEKHLTKIKQFRHHILQKGNSH